MGSWAHTHVRATGHRLCVLLVLDASISHALPASGLVRCTSISPQLRIQKPWASPARSLWLSSEAKAAAVWGAETHDQKSGLLQSDILDLSVLVLE